MTILTNVQAPVTEWICILRWETYDGTNSYSTTHLAETHTSNEAVDKALEAHEGSVDRCKDVQVFPVSGRRGWWLIDVEPIPETRYRMRRGMDIFPR